ncbi:COG7, partial [Symbiodinium microadriaticum]
QASQAKDNRKGGGGRAGAQFSGCIENGGIFRLMGAKANRKSDPNFMERSTRDKEEPTTCRRKRRHRRSLWPLCPAPASGNSHVLGSPSSHQGPIYAAPIVIDVDAADDEPEMELLPRTVSCFAGCLCFAAGSYQISALVDYQTCGAGRAPSVSELLDDREAKLLEAVDWPSSSHDKWEPATHLVMTHRLRTLEWYAEFLQIDVRRLTKLGSEHLLLQFMRKPDAGSPEDRV